MASGQPGDLRSIIRDYGWGTPVRARSVRFTGTVIAILEAKRAGLRVRSQFLGNLLAGTIVGVVAIPLVMAFAIASGARPEQGLYTAILAGLFGGTRAQISGPTGAIARTATNIRNGASSPVAGIVHSLFLLLVMLLLAPIAAHIPLAALAAILFYVAWNMSDVKRFLHIARTSPRAKLERAGVLAAAGAGSVVASLEEFAARIDAGTRPHDPGPPPA